MEVTPLTITPSDPLAKCLLPMPTILCFAGLDILVSNGEIIPPGDTSVIKYATLLF